MAGYAKDHGAQFGRLLMIKAEAADPPYKLSDIDLNDPNTREKALQLQGPNEINGLYISRDTE